MLINHAQNEQNLRNFKFFLKILIFTIKTLISPNIKSIGPIMRLLAFLVGNHLNLCNLISLKLINPSNEKLIVTFGARYVIVPTRREEVDVLSKKIYVCLMLKVDEEIFCCYYCVIVLQTFFFILKRLFLCLLIKEEVC